MKYPSWYHELLQIWNNIPNEVLKNNPVLKILMENKPMNNKISEEDILKNLRKHFRYYSDGTPDIFSYGDFKAGVTSAEIDEYLRVFLNKTKVGNDRKKFNKVAGCNTCPVVIVEGNSIGLMYRHDVERFARKMILGTATYWD